MEIAPGVYLNQTPGMSLVLSDELIIAVVSSGSQYGCAFWPNFGQKLIDRRMHAEIQINHQAEQLERLAVRIPRMNYN